jgi:3-oxoacyl-ACP reductase-like protein
MTRIRKEELNRLDRLNILKQEKRKIEQSLVEHEKFDYVNELEKILNLRKKWEQKHKDDFSSIEHRLYDNVFGSCRYDSFSLYNSKKRQIDINHKYNEYYNTPKGLEIRENFINKGIYNEATLSVELLIEKLNRIHSFMKAYNDKIQKLDMINEEIFNLRELYY